MLCRPSRGTESFFKGALARGQTWDLLIFIYFLSLSSALDNSATSPPLEGYLKVCLTFSVHLEASDGLLGAAHHGVPVARVGVERVEAVVTLQAVVAGAVGRRDALVASHATTVTSRDADDADRDDCDDGATLPEADAGHLGSQPLWHLCFLPPIKFCFSDCSLVH